MRYITESDILAVSGQTKKQKGLFISVGILSVSICNVFRHLK